MAAAAPPRHIGTSSVYMDRGGADRPTPAIDSVGGTSSGAGAGRRPGFNLFSRPVCAAVFVSFALCVIVFRVYSFLARRGPVSSIRRRVLGRVRDNINCISGWSAHVPVPSPPPASATTVHRVDVPPPPPVAPARRVDVPPPTRAAPARFNSTSNSGLGDCPVCLEPLYGRTNVMAAHACSHVFHASCIEPWLHNRGSYHVCRCTANPTSTSNSSPIGDCLVCLEPLPVSSGDVRAAHACGHVFHSRCIKPWLHQRGSCPVCPCTAYSTSTSTSTTPPPAPSVTARCASSPCALAVATSGRHMRAGCGHVFHSHCIERWLRRRGSCPVCRCTVNSNSSSNTNSNPSANSSSTTTSTPISNTNSTSTTTYTSKSGPVGKCPVCLEPLRVGGGDVRAAHACGHVFHSRCIERWLGHRNSCPVCRCTCEVQSQPWKRSSICCCQWWCSSPPRDRGRGDFGRYSGVGTPEPMTMIRKDPRFSFPLQHATMLVMTVEVTIC